jgi:hypothetical protein
MTVYDRKLTIEQNLAMLAATPSRIVDLTQPLYPVQLLTRPNPANGLPEMCWLICAPVLTCGVNTSYKQSHMRQFERIVKALASEVGV